MNNQMLKSFLYFKVFQREMSVAHNRMLMNAGLAFTALLEKLQHEYGSKGGTVFPERSWDLTRPAEIPLTGRAPSHYRSGNNATLTHLQSQFLAERVQSRISELAAENNVHVAKQITDHNTQMTLKRRNDSCIWSFMVSPKAWQLIRFPFFAELAAW